MNLFDIRGQVAIITGGSKGIGKGIALAYADAGADIAIVSSRPQPDTIEQIRQSGVRCLAYTYDLSNSNDLQSLVNQITADFGKIDILVNNAGAQLRHPCAAFPEDDWDYIMNVNAKSVFFLCQAVGRLMIAQGRGKIINIASLASFQGGLKIPAYAGSKGAVAQFTKTLANEWAPLGVNVNCITPGYIDTDMNEALMNDPVRSRQILERIPAGRWGLPDDLAGAAIFLASRASDYIDGVNLPVDGGWLSR